MVERRDLELFRETGAIVRREPAQFTMGLKLKQNAVLTLGGLGALMAPVLFLAVAGVGTTQLLVVPFVALLWTIALVDHTALWRNRGLRGEAARRLQRRRPDLAHRSFNFVGFSTPHYLSSGLAHCLDTHEDIGVLCLTSQALIFMGDSMDATIPRRSITSVTEERDIAYSWMGLHWIKVAYDLQGDSAAVFVQSRDHDRLSRLPRTNSALLRRLQIWARDG